MTGQQGKSDGKAATGPNPRAGAERSGSSQQRSGQPSNDQRPQQGKADAARSGQGGTRGGSAGGGTNR